MEKPIITAKVKNLKQEAWIDLYANKWRIGTVWGKGKAEYLTEEFLATYRLVINDSDTVFYVDEIKRREEAVKPIKQEVAV